MMNWGGPEFVLAIIAMVMLARVMRTAIRAKHGLPDDEDGRSGRKRHRRETREDTAEVVRLREENRQLTGRLEASEDRLAVLERIVTDRSYSLASEIEALRDTGRDTGRDTRPAARNDSGVPLDLPKKEEA